MGWCGEDVHGFGGPDQVQIPTLPLPAGVPYPHGASAFSALNQSPLQRWHGKRGPFYALMQVDYSRCFFVTIIILSQSQREKQMEFS